MISLIAKKICAQFRFAWFRPSDSSFSFSLGLRRLGKICDDRRICAAIVFVFLFFPVILGNLVILFFHVVF